MSNFRQTLHNLVTVRNPTALISRGANSDRTSAGNKISKAIDFVGPMGGTAQEPTTNVTPSEGSKPNENIGVFITPEALLTFPIATAVLTFVCSVLRTVFPNWGSSNLVPFIGAFILGAFIYIISLPENSLRRVKFIGAGIAVLNSFMLAASALGIQT